MRINGRPAAHPLDALRRRVITKCYLCGAPPIAVGVFVPHDEETRAAALTLRLTPLAEGKTPALCYGLCAERADQIGEDLADRVERKMVEEAAEVRRRTC